MRPMDTPKTKHSGGCHCGRVRFDVEVDLAQVIACNCSICSKLGVLWTFVEPAQFTLHGERDELTLYQFNRHVIHHRFCPVCGVEAFADGSGPDGKAMIAVNVRCLDDVDVDALTVAPFDGKSL